MSGGGRTAIGSETWYRGESKGVPPARPGGDLHDFGDGTYYTSDLDVAKRYAEMRAGNNADATRVYEIPIDTASFRTLDLTKDPKWLKYLSSKPVPGGRTVEGLIRLANENYSRFFEAFLQDNNIDLNRYEAVIGPEFVRGGKQLCILMKNSQPSLIQARLRPTFQLIFAGGKDVRISNLKIGQGAGALPEIPVTNSKLGRIVGNQNAMMVAGQLLGSLALSIGEIGIERQVRSDLQTKKAKAISNILASGEGVLVIIRLAQWQIPNFNGQRNKMLLSVDIESGPTMQAALQNWRGVSRLVAPPPDGWESFENYSWIEPAK